MPITVRSRAVLVVATALSLLLIATLWHIVTSAPRRAAASGGADRAGVLVASAPVYPDAHVGKEVAVLATKRRSLHRTWRQFDLPAGPPLVNFEKHFVLFVGTGESGSCPEEFRHIERVEGKRLVKVHIHTAWGPDCTEDWRPRTFVIGAGRKHFPRGDFDVRIGAGKRVAVDRR